MAANSVPVVLRLVASSVCIARRAGQIIRDVMAGGSLAIVEKGKNDLQTEADRSAQRCIVASLYKQYPKLLVIGEEDLNDKESMPDDWIETGCDQDVLQHAKNVSKEMSAITDDEIVVWVDPLDGTSEYTQGLLDHVTVLIGISVGGKAVAGVIYQPYYNYQAGAGAKLGRVIWGMNGIGAFGFNTQKIAADHNIIVTTRSHGTGTVNDAVEACQPTEVIRAGGAGHKVLMVLEGRANAYVFASPGCKKWDTCAPQAVLEAAGGRLTDIHGANYQYHAAVHRPNKRGVLATLAPGAQQWYLDRIPDSVKTALPAHNL